MTPDVYNVNKPRGYHHGDLRRALIEAGSDLLAERGIEGLSLREVARRAGVSAMAPYRHFADKDALLLAIAAHGFAAFRDRLLEADAAADPRAAFADQGMAYVRFAMAHPALFRLMFGPLTAPAEGDGAPAVSQSILQQRVETLVPAADVAATVTAAWALVHGLAALALDGRLPDAEGAARGAIALFVQRMAP